MSSSSTLFPTEDKMPNPVTAQEIADKIKGRFDRVQLLKSSNHLTLQGFVMIPDLCSPNRFTVCYKKHKSMKELYVCVYQFDQKELAKLHSELANILSLKTIVKKAFQKLFTPATRLSSTTPAQAPLATDDARYKKNN